MTKQRIALFGGTFDPIHRGHLTIARAAADRFALDQVLFAPAGRQPLKLSGAAAHYADRLAMVELACRQDPRFIPSTLDAPREDGTPNYTYATLEALQHANPEAKLYNLAGADSFHTIATWREPQRLLTAAEWIVSSRPGSALVTPQNLSLSPAQRHRIHLLDDIHEDVSATDLRQRLHTGDPCLDLLPPAVAAYIADHHLYR